MCQKVLDKFKENFPEHEIDTGVSVKTASTLPVASGLSSSSATSNAVIMATHEALKTKYLDGPAEDYLNSYDLINMGVDASLEAGVTITGAFDDASASFSVVTQLPTTLIGRFSRWINWMNKIY